MELLLSKSYHNNQVHFAKKLYSVTDKVANPQK